MFIYLVCFVHKAIAKPFYVTCQKAGLISCSKIIPYIWRILDLVSSLLSQFSHVDSAQILCESLRCFGFWELRLCEGKRLVPNDSKPKHCGSTLHPFCLLPCVLPLSLFFLRLCSLSHSILPMLISHPLHHSLFFPSLLKLFLVCICVSPSFPPCTSPSSSAVD